MSGFPIFSPLPTHMRRWIDPAERGDPVVWLQAGRPAGISVEVLSSGDWSVVMRRYGQSIRAKVSMSTLRPEQKWTAYLAAWLRRMRTVLLAKALHQRRLIHQLAGNGCMGTGRSYVGALLMMNMAGMFPTESGYGSDAPTYLLRSAWAEGGYCIDAPELLPAGGCRFHRFDAEPDDWMVEPITCEREAA